MDNNSASLLQKAEQLTEIERWREAIPLLSKVISVDPQNFQALCLLSFCFYELQNYKFALRNAEKAISIEPEAEWGHRLRSIILGALEKKKESLKSAEEAVRLAPFALFTLQTLVYAYLSNHQPQKAKEIAEKMRENFPESEASFFALGNVYLQIGNPFEAENCFREALRLNPVNSNVRNNLGVALLNQEQRKPKSIINRNDTISLFGNSPENEAVKHFNEAIKLEPNNQYVIENLKYQFSYAHYLFLIFSLIPFVTLSFLVIPGATIMITLIGIISFGSVISETYKRRKQISPEMKMFLKSMKQKAFARYFEDLRRVVNHVLLRNWQPHALAVLAAILNSINFNEVARPWILSFSILLIVISGIWLAMRLSRN